MSKKDNFSQAMFEMFGLGKAPEEKEEPSEDNLEGFDHLESSVADTQSAELSNPLLKRTTSPLLKNLRSSKLPPSLLLLVLWMRTTTKRPILNSIRPARLPPHPLLIPILNNSTMSLSNVQTAPILQRAPAWRVHSAVTAMLKFAVISKARLPLTVA